MVSEFTVLGANPHYRYPGPFAKEPPGSSASNMRFALVLRCRSGLPLFYQQQTCKPGYRGFVKSNLFHIEVPNRVLSMNALATRELLAEHRIDAQGHARSRRYPDLIFIPSPRSRLPQSPTPLLRLSRFCHGYPIDCPSIAPRLVRHPDNARYFGSHSRDIPAS